MYLHNPLHHDHGAQFREIASFEPFGESGGTRVATTSTTTGANLLVSGSAPGETDASVDQIRSCQTQRSVDDTSSHAFRRSLVWESVFTADPRWRLTVRTNLEFLLCACLP